MVLSQAAGLARAFQKSINNQWPYESRSNLGSFGQDAGVCSRARGAEFEVH